VSKIFPIKVIDVELSQPLMDIDGLEKYGGVWGLVRLHRTPLGIARAKVTNGRCPAAAIRRAMFDQLKPAILRHTLLESIKGSRTGSLSIETLLDLPEPAAPETHPMISVVICTRDRTDYLEVCLEAIQRLEYENLEVLVVDNAPSNERTRELVRENFPGFRYVLEPRPGLNWARNRGIEEASGEIIAFTDDDAVVDGGWAQAIAMVFMEAPEAMAVTGLVVPYELETEAQILFERYGGFGRGFERRWFHAAQEKNLSGDFRGSGKYGTGANMAFRRQLFEKIGVFDPALDVGTVTNGGGDLEIFYRTLREGYILVYEPCAIVRHRHRRDYPKLKEQIANNGIGFYSYLVRSALAYPEDQWALIRFGIWWFLWWSVRRLILSFFNPQYFKRELILAELLGSLIGLGRYQKARRTAVKIQRAYDSTAPVKPRPRRGRFYKIQRTFAVRTIDLALPLEPVTGLAEHQLALIYLTHRQQLSGTCTIANGGESISRARLCDEIVRQIGPRLLDLEGKLGEELLWAAVMSNFVRHIQGGETKGEEKSVDYLPSTIPISVVVATRDRPADLRRCLEGIASQETRRRVEVIVVDNNPDSGLTPAVVAEFPDVVLVQEKRKGLSYARNRGIAASTGDIIITTDDDVTIPPHWLEALLAPFSQPDVMLVTGNILPAELSSKAQVLFEEYGGLSRGVEDFERGLEWFVNYRFRAVPTWDLGATANAAFRASVFADQEIGLFHEALGAGSPTGCSEDAYLYYKILKAGYRAAYRANAFVWHHHRRDMAGLRRQIYNYSKGHVAYNLLTVFNDHDLRGLVRLMIELPMTYLFRVKEYLRGRSHYPPDMILLEIAGSLAGGPALVGSLLRARRLGKSDPYIPAKDRAGVTFRPGKPGRPSGFEYESNRERILQGGSEFHDIRMEDPVSEN